ncbi:MAG: hypothetical protein R3298_13480 [Gammaproteobacteria bacterium]|nr:hypothetical protein [Gammaproteobacteria bacterium]
MLSRIFGKTPDYPPLPVGSPLGARIHDLNDYLSALADRVRQPLEVLPLPNAAYVFTGDPPRKFDLAWVRDGEIGSLRALVEQKGVPQEAVEAAVVQLEAAYRARHDAERYTADLGEDRVVVTDSPELVAEVDAVVRKLVG